MADTMADSDITARGLLMLRLRPILTTTDTATARGLLSLRPRLILTTTVLVTDLDTPDTSDTPDTLDTSTANRLHQDLSVNHRLDLRQKWIVISLKFPSPVLQFQCYHTKSLFMVSRKQENQSGKNPTNIEINKKKK